MRVPLWLKLPGLAGGGRRIRRVVDQVDLWPTVLELVGRDSSSFERPRFGDSLLGFEEAARMPSLSIARLNKNSARTQESVVSGVAKLIHCRSTVRPHHSLEIFDLAEDPLERRPLGGADSLRAGSLRAQLHLSTIRWEPAQSTQTEVEEDLEQSLRALGYIE